MGWFWSDTTTSLAAAASSMQQTTNTSPPPACPMNKAFQPPSTQPTCPVKTTTTTTTTTTPPSASQTFSASSTSTLSKLNPLNYMPQLSQSRAPNQSITLPTSREASTIPRGDAEANWEYPSPQQMYNAMLRKGYDDTPIDAVESMVAVHNFLNEGAWAEIVAWERRFGRGLGKGWEYCKLGEERFEEVIASEREVVPEPRLIRFQGRPKDMTPKAKILQALGQVYPSRFSGDAPFDRHDWFVQRQEANGDKEELRYVIDYYSAPPEPTGEPVFYLDVRPAIDSPGAAVARLIRWGGDLWYRASGAEATYGESLLMRVKKAANLA